MTPVTRLTPGVRESGPTKTFRGAAAPGGVGSVLSGLRSRSVHGVVAQQLPVVAAGVGALAAYEGDSLCPVVEDVVSREEERVRVEDAAVDQRLLSVGDPLLVEMACLG